MMVIGSYARDVLERASRASVARVELELPASDARSGRQRFERLIQRLVAGRLTRYPR